MTVVMKETITESINDGRTVQAFQKDASYDVPDRIGQVWIGRGCAQAPGKPAPSVKGKE